MEAHFLRRPAASNSGGSGGLLLFQSVLKLSAGSSGSGPTANALRRPPTTTQEQRRHGHKQTNASASRTKRALNIPPHPDFLVQGAERERIIFNPPAAEPSVFHTPFKFLPRSDPRRRANLAAVFEAAARKTSSNSNDDFFGNEKHAAAATTTTITANPAAMVSHASFFPEHDNTPSIADSRRGGVAAEGGYATAEAPEQDWNPSGLPPIAQANKNKMAGPPRAWTITPADVAEIRRLRTEDPENNTVAMLAQRYGCAKLFIMMCCNSPREYRDRRAAEHEAVRARWGPRRAKARQERQRRWDMLMAGEL